ncbi:hypothetical protein JRQ81_018410 [Phrynocephalus forsythii]|uniref:Solute carrier family 22 member 13-like n=1 Tax=Phrynocephalus forsythii TaxID=171643 RepID=A0A9Q0XNM3_9SAUR|nr:hypothetical protein JRQ81_018410 [Phrynocephalus forsythii]
MFGTASPMISIWWDLLSNTSGYNCAESGKVNLHFVDLPEPDGAEAVAVDRRDEEKVGQELAMTDVGEIIKALGEFGRFQYGVVTLITLSSLSIGFHMFSQLFMVAPERHYCNTDWLVSLGLNLTEEEHLNLTLPRKADGTFEECFMYSPVGKELNTILQYGLNVTEKCRDGWVYPSKKVPTLVTQTILAGLAYALQDWKSLQVSISTPVFALFFFLWVLPESPRWLVTKGKLKPEKKTTSESILELFTNPHLRKVTFLMSSIWFANSLTYYGLSLNVGSFGLDIYLTQLIFGAVEVPARFSTLFLMQWQGRRKCQALCLLVGGVVCLLITVVPKDLPVMRTVLAIIGKFTISGSFMTSYVYSTELFPTVIRQTGVGLCQMAARLAGIISPLARLLENYHVSIPVLIFGSTAVVGGILSFFLPETGGTELPDHIQDVVGKRNGPRKTVSSNLENGCFNQKEDSRLSEWAKATSFVSWDSNNAPACHGKETEDEWVDSAPAHGGQCGF